MTLGSKPCSWVLSTSPAMRLDGNKNVWEEISEGR